MVKNEKSLLKKYAAYLIVGLLATVILLWGNAFLSHAEDDEWEGYVYDMAGLLTEDELAQLQTQTDDAYTATEIDIYVLTIDDAEGKTSREYADDLLFDWGYGGPDSYPAVMILVDMDNREIYLSTAGQAIDYLTDDRIESLVSSGSGYLSDEDYYGGISTVISGITDYVEKGLPSKGYRYNEETGEVTKYNRLTTIDIAIALISGIALFIFMFVCVIRSYTVNIGGEKYKIKQNSRLTLSRREDRFTHKTVTHVHISKDDKDGSSGKSSTHSSSGGGSFGGGGSSF